MISRRNLLLLLTGLCLTIASARSQTRYMDKVFEVINTRTYTYSDTLKLDFYYAPKDKLTQRPLIILMHGGGFAKGSRNGRDEQKFCTAMAEKGYAVVSLSYRLTRKNKSFGCDCPVPEKIATYRAAMQDLGKALNFLHSREADLKIDLNQVILAGSSAGASTILNSLFMRSHYEFRDIEFRNTNFVGAISFSGAMLDSEYLRSKKPVPIVMMHGEKDRTLMVGKGPHRSCGPTNVGYLILSGPLAMTEKFRANENPFLCVIDPEGTHEWSNYGYSYIPEISSFLYRTIFQGEQIQTFQIIKHVAN